MKPQDILFLVLLIVLLIIRKPRFIVGVGLFCLVLSIPLFSRHIFFTAERLVMYAAGFFLTVVIFLLFYKRK